MIGITAIVAMSAAALIARKLEKASEYKTPKGKYRNRYK